MKVIQITLFLILMALLSGLGHSASRIQAKYRDPNLYQFPDESLRLELRRFNRFSIASIGVGLLLLGFSMLLM